MAKTKSTESSLFKQPRRLKPAKRKWWQPPKRVKYQGPKLDPAWKLFKRSLTPLKDNKKLFAVILAIYAALSLLLVRGFSSTVQLSSVKESLRSTSGGQLALGTNLLSSLFGSSGTTTAAGSTYQSILFILMSLVIIWALRSVYEKKTAGVSAKAAFYQSTYPLVPFVLVLMVISLQLIPLVVGTTIYGLIAGNGLATTGLEQLILLVILFGLTVWSLYMVTASLFALYVVTLPGMLPLQALRSAKDLVHGRRWLVMRRVLFLPIFLSVLISVLMLPVVLWLTPIAEWVFFGLSLAVLIVVHSYLYNLYRELI